MHGRSEPGNGLVRRPGRGLFAALCFSLSGCGSDVLVAEQAGRSNASHETDAGDLDADLPNVRLCGRARCVDFDIELSGMQVPTIACCSDPERSACGAVIPGLSKCVELEHLGHPDLNCPSFPGTIIGVGTLQGCCEPEGTCGVVDPKYGFGCAQLPYISQLAPACMY
jgi:hypothetical protein